VRFTISDSDTESVDSTSSATTSNVWTAAEAADHANREASSVLESLKIQLEELSHQVAASREAVERHREGDEEDGPIFVDPVEDVLNGHGLEAHEQTVVWVMLALILLMLAGKSNVLNSYQY